VIRLRERRRGGPLFPVADPAPAEPSRGTAPGSPRPLGVLRTADRPCAGSEPAGIRVTGVGAAGAETGTVVVPAHPLGGTEPVAAHAHVAVTVAADLTCRRVEERFALEPELGSVVVRDRDGCLGLLTRERLATAMTGRLGFGRALWSGKSVRGITDWTPLILSGSTGITEVCRRLRDRDVERRYDDLLVVDPGVPPHQVSAAELFDALARRLAVQAVSDPLTGLANRALFLERLDRVCLGPGCGPGPAGADVPGTPRRVVVVYLDLDAMKQVNDVYGHDAGDALIVSVAHRLTATAREGDLVARIGGDEFAVLALVPADRLTRSAAAAIGERFRTALAEPDAALPPGIHAHASVGVSAGGADAVAHTLFTAADMAMYQAKRAGGNAVRVAVDVGRTLRVLHPGAGRALSEAIESGQLSLYYQPLVHLEDGSPAGVEALLRWRHPQHGLLTPDAFLADAERAGQLLALDLWVLRQVCVDLASWTARSDLPAPAHVNVNLTLAGLRAPDIADRVLRLLAAHELDPTQLRIELPESADLEVLVDVVPQLERLRAAGVGIVLDDMGAGSSTLRHLSVLPVTGFKIDQLFVSRMLHSPSDHAVVKVLADLGHNLGIPVTVEGVETPGQAAVLRSLGINSAQGYHFGYPRPL